VLVWFVFPRKEQEDALLASYQAEDTAEAAVEEPDVAHAPPVPH
jgi:hypothetical protein